MCESQRAVLEHSVQRSRYRDLRLLDEVGVDAMDLGGSASRDISAPEICAAAKDLVVAKVGEVRRRRRLGRAVSVAGEDIDAQDGFFTIGNPSHQGEEKGLDQSHFGLCFALGSVRLQDITE